MEVEENTTVSPFAPIPGADKKTIIINLEESNQKNINHDKKSSTLICTIEAYNKFLSIVAKSLDFHKKEKCELKWEPHQLGYEYSFSWMEGTVADIPFMGGFTRSHKDKGLTIPDIINEILDAWTAENSLDEKISGTSPWKHEKTLKYMKMLWINNLFHRLMEHSKFKIEEIKDEGYGKIVDEVGKDLSKHLPIVQKIGNTNAIIGEGKVCNDPQLILGLILSNPEEFFIFKDCTPLSDMSEAMYRGHDLGKMYEGEYFGVEMIWESKSPRLDSWVAHTDKSGSFIGDDNQEYYEVLPFDCYDKNDTYGSEENKQRDVRAWIVDQRTFDGMRRLVAKKFVFERSREENLITTGMKEIGWEEDVKDEDKIELLKTILGPSSKSLEKYKPLSNREIPVSDNGIELIAKKLLDIRESNFDKENMSEKAKLNLVKGRVEKHRLGSKIIEIGQFLDWWDDLGDVFFDIFSRKGKDVELGVPYWDDQDKITELPLRILGAGVRKFFDNEYDHEERDVATMGR